MKTLTPDQIHNHLLNSDKILSIQGQIKFYLGDVNIIVKQRDVVGNIIQEWLEGWLKHNKINYSTNPNTQMPPDFFLDPSDKTRNLLEVKAFNYKSSPGFDIADFVAFQQEILSKPYMLNAKYLIFGYDMTEEGFVIIKKLWIKNLWEICRPMKGWSLNLQVKKNVIHKIRPAKWYSSGKAIKFLPFDCLEDFLSAISECLYEYPLTHSLAKDWKKKMIKSYNDHYGIALSIPRWEDVKDKYYK